jgi:hypothetical protein
MMSKSAASTTCEQLTLFVEVSPAKMSVLPDNGRDWTASALRSGQSSPVSLARLGPDGSWLKMYQDCYQVTMDGSLQTFSGTWPRAGMMQNGTVYQLQPLASPTDATEYGLLPTPVVYDSTPGGPNNHYKGLGNAARTGRIATMWPTPKASQDGTSPRTLDMVREGTAERSLMRVILMPEYNPDVPTTGQLNPQWVEWLMGYPDGWTDLED